MKRIKNLIMSLVASFMFVVPVLAPVTVRAQDCLEGEGGISECIGSGIDSTDPNSAEVDATERVNEIITLVINTFSLIVGVVSVIMIIFGGFKYITSGGEGSNITGAKNTILFAIIGLVIVALAQIIVQFVLDKTTSV